MRVERGSDRLVRSDEDPLEQIVRAALVEQPHGLVQIGVRIRDALRALAVHTGTLQRLAAPLDDGVGGGGGRGWLLGRRGHAAILAHLSPARRARATPRNGYAHRMDTETLEVAAERVRARFGGEPQLVAPARLPTRGAVFVCAFSDSGGQRRWVVLREDGDPVIAVGDVRTAVEIVALCETAEEVAAAVDVEEALPALAAAWRLAGELGEAEAELATHATYQAVEALGPLVEGLRIAEATHLDAVAGAATLVGDRFDLLKESAGGISARLTGAGIDPLEPLAERLWEAIRILSRNGAPDRFREAIEAAMGPAAALADDVIDNYAVPLDEQRRVEEENG